MISLSPKSAEYWNNDKNAISSAYEFAKGVFTDVDARHGREPQGEPVVADGYSEGDQVQWSWGNGTGTGTIRKVYTRKTTRKIKGSEVTREASEDKPAYFIEQEDGDEVLKGHSEVKKA